MEMTTFDLERARRDTPGTANVAHLNNAGAALPPTQVTDAVIAHLHREARIGGYEAAAEAHDQVEHTYDAIARLIGCQADEIAIMENATRAWDMAFYGLTFAPGDRILTAHAEYSSNVIAFLQVAARTGAVVEVVDNDESGQLSVERPAPQTRRRHRPGEARRDHTRSDPGRPGQPRRGDRRRNPGSRSPLPARCLPVGGAVPGRRRSDRLRPPLRARPQVPARTTGHGLPLRPQHHARTRWSRRSWTCTQQHGPPPTATRSGPTPDASRAGRPTTQPRSASESQSTTPCPGAWRQSANASPRLADRLRQLLSEVDGVSVHDQGRRRCGIVTFTVDGVSSQEVQQRLAKRGVNVSVSLVEYARLDLPDRGLPDLVRASVHYYNTEDELHRLIDALPPPR